MRRANVMVKVCEKRPVFAQDLPYQGHFVGFYDTGINVSYSHSRRSVSIIDYPYSEIRQMFLKL